MITIDINRCTNSFDRLIYERFVNPYKLYLQKRNLFGCAAHSSEDENYQLINLIRNGLSFTDIIFTIGRYLYKDNKFLGDFVTVIAKDLSQLYKMMRLQLN